MQKLFFALPRKVLKNLTIHFEDGVKVRVFKVERIHQSDRRLKIECMKRLKAPLNQIFWAVAPMQQCDEG